MLLPPLSSAAALRFGEREKKILAKLTDDLVYTVHCTMKEPFLSDLNASVGLASTKVLLTMKAEKASHSSEITFPGARKKTNNSIKHPPVSQSEVT